MAACPPYFMGNFDGRTDVDGNKTDYTNADVSYRYKGRFSVSNNKNEVDMLVSDYFNNCQIVSPNGISGKFQIPDIISGKFGSAGQGGTGGGSMDKSASSGGDGAPGYVVLDWTR